VRPLSDANESRDRCEKRTKGSEELSRLDAPRKRRPARAHIQWTFSCSRDPDRRGNQSLGRVHRALKPFDQPLLRHTRARPHARVTELIVTRIVKILQTPLPGWIEVKHLKTLAASSERSSGSTRRRRTRSANAWQIRNQAGRARARALPASDSLRSRNSASRSGGWGEEEGVEKGGN